MIKKPAVLGGKPAFPNPLPIAAPTLASRNTILAEMEVCLASGMLTNDKFVAEFEARCASYLDVKYVIAVSNCTTGLILVLKCLGLEGKVLVPSFTFSATVHAIVWNGLKPVFVDCRPDTFNISPEQIQSRVSSGTSAILGVHVYGNPCEAQALEKIAADLGIPLIFDAAHGFGAKYPDGSMVGTRGVAEVFSLSPTKVLVAGEGGLIATNDSRLAEQLRLARNYGKTANYDCSFPGLNGRMSEFHAILGLANLAQLNDNLQARLALVERYRLSLGQIPGLRLQKTLPGSQNVFKDFGVYVDSEVFGLSRDELGLCLARENIETRNYFYPPTHQLSSYKALEQDSSALRVTEDVSGKIICLPLFSHMSLEQVDVIADYVDTIYRNSREIRGYLRKEPNQGEHR